MEVKEYVYRYKIIITVLLSKKERMLAFLYYKSLDAAILRGGIGNPV